LECQIQTQRMINCKRCGCKTEWKSRKKYCPSCALIIHKETNKAYIKKNGRIPKKHIKSRVLCKCPKCENLHYVAMRWTGNGMPRIYCESCKERGLS